MVAAFQRRALSPCVQSWMWHGPLDVPALELLPCVETSVTSVFLHANKSDKCAKIYEVQRRPSGTNGTRVPLADSAGMEATTVRRGGDWSGFGGRAYGHAAVSCMQIMTMWVFSGTRAEFFVFQSFTQPVGNQGDSSKFAAIARLPWPTCLSWFCWGRSLSIFFSS